MAVGDNVDLAAVTGAQIHAEAEDARRKSDVGMVNHHLPEPGEGMDLEDYPTEEERATLRRVSAPMPWKIFTIAFVEACERFSFYGSTIVFQNYIQAPLPDGSVTGAGGGCEECTSGAMGMGQRAATGMTTFSQFWNYTTPLLGAYIADQYWGRYKTITVALGIDLIGHLILIISAIPPVITKSNNSFAALVVAILVIGCGTGGFKPNVNPLIVEQLPLDHLKVTTLKTGERVIIDPAITANRVYNWFYFFINVGSLIGQITMVFAEKYVGYWLAFLLPTLMLSLCPLVLMWGKKRYHQRPPGGSVLGKAFSTWWLAMKGRWHFNPIATWKHMHDGTFWENVKPSHFAPGTKPKWMTFDDAWVDEVARGFSACAVFLWFPLYWLTYNQMTNNLISQAATMQLNGVPNEVVTNLDPLALIIFIPICDRFLYPALRKAKINFSPIKRIAFGFFLGAAGMIWSAVMQVYIYRQSECGDYAGNEDCAPVSISVWAQSGAYVLIAFSEIFASITSLEYAHSKAPKNMRSMVQALALFMSAISSALGEAFVSLSADPLLVWNYAVMAILSGVGGIIFWIQFRGLDAEEDQLNELPEGKMFVDGSDEEDSLHQNSTGSEKATDEKRALEPAPAAATSDTTDGIAPAEQATETSEKKAQPPHDEL